MASTSSPHILITGAASGIGRALAARYATCGARLSLLDLAFDATAPLPAGAVAYTADVRSADAVAIAIGAAAAASGSLDLVIHSAGVGGNYRPLERVDPDDFTRTVDINLNGTYRVVHAAVPHLAPQATIALIGSLAGFAPNVTYGDYCASKAGVAILAAGIASRRPLAILGPRARLAYMLARWLPQPLKRRVMDRTIARLGIEPAKLSDQFCGPWIAANAGTRYTKRLIGEPSQTAPAR